MDIAPFFSIMKACTACCGASAVSLTRMPTLASCEMMISWRCIAS